jgi:uncharacterized membrane protein
LPFKTHDPYLNTVKREIKDKYYRERKQHMSEKKESNSFLSQKVYLHDFINLPEGTLNILLFIAFVVIPYVAGLAFIFFLIANANFDTFEDININDYLIYWTIGYELLAFILMILVIFSAIKFRKSR